ncbi:MAG: diguanylate cyclase [Candidatus Fermentibacteria bacterium]|nr:diguanylate cyclase [Candidatus Fermentibacteria bacterium]
MSSNGKDPGIDPLTGLRDRSVLPYLNQQFSKRDHPWSLVILDIDHFKLVNDIYGHLAGDAILSHVGQTIRINLKSNDFALRFGGDEFVVVLPDTSGDNALDLAQRLLFEFKKEEIPGGSSISVSMGIAQSRPEDQEVSDLISMADQALYHAKETGRGRFVLAEDLNFHKDVEPDFSHMVGRRDELHQLRELVDSASADSARFCLLTGFQGTGKTKLVEEMFNYCQFKQLSVFTTEAHPVYQEENFLVLNIIRKALNQLSESQIYSLTTAVGQIEPLTAEQLAEFTFKERSRTISAASDTNRARNRNDLGIILKEISRIIPFVMVMDGLHWASEECIQFAAEVIASIPEANILYIGMSRTSETIKLLTSVWVTIPSKRIHLAPLEPTDVRTMVFFAMKTPGIPDQVQNYMMRQSGGNALFLRKLISWALETGYLSIGKGDICIWQEPDEEEYPGEISSIIELMLGKCTAAEKTILKRAALAGDPLDLELLSELTSMDEYNIAEKLDRFVEMGLVKDNGSFYTFSYGVMKSDLISRISPSLRQILHEKTASFLEARNKNSRDELTTQIAYHFCKSRNSSKATEYSRNAANMTFVLGLHFQSIYWYKKYLKLVSTSQCKTGFLIAHINIGILFSITGQAELAEKHLLKALTLTDDPVDLCAIYHRLGRNYQRRSMYPTAIDYFKKAVTTGNSIESPTGVLVNNMVGAHLEASFIYRLQNKISEAIEQLKLTENLLRGNTPGIDKALEGMYFARMADIESETGSPEKALEQYRKGLEVCVREKDPTGEALILNNMHGLYAYSGDYNSSLDSLKQVIKLNNKLGDKLGLAIGYYNIAETYTQLNMLDLAKRYFQMYIEMNSKIENRLGMAYGQFGLGKLALVTGKNRKASEYFFNASKIFGELKCLEMKDDTELNRIKALLSLGEYKVCQEILQEIDEDNSNSTVQNWILHFRGILLFYTADDQETINRAVTFIEHSIANEGEITHEDLIFMYGNLYKVLKTGDNNEKIITILGEALGLLEVILENITSDSIRNSILSRSDMEAFLDICRERGIASPVLNS